MTTYAYHDNLESERIITRKLTMDDIGTWTEFFLDQDAIEFLPNPEALSPKEWAKHWIERQVKRYENEQFGLQALIDKKTKQFVGQCGLLKQTIDDQNEIEVGYHIIRKHWGQGYAPEAAKLFINYAFQHGISDSVTSIIHVDNIRSQRVAEKNGLTREKQVIWSGRDVFVYRINK